MLKNRKILWAILTIVAVIALIAGLVLVRQRQNIKEQAAPATSLYVYPANQNVYPGDLVTVRVRMTTGTNLITGVDVRLNFNPAAFEVQSIARGTGIPTFTITADNQTGYDNVNGKVSYVAFTLDKTKYVTGSAIEVLQVIMRAKTTASLGTYPITFGTDSSASAVSENVNVLTTKTAGNLVVTARPTPSPTPTRSPSPTPTKSPSPTPTRSPSPTPTRSPSPTPTRSPSPTPTRSPSPTPTKSPSPTPTPTPRPGDVNGDRAVDIIDIGLLIDAYKTQPVSDPRCDLDHDGQVNIVDIGIVIDNYDL